MKRFHVHVSVNDLAEATRFYSALFAVAPTVVKDDYAKWMLDDPRINFAISRRGHAAGVNHLGLQVESGDELTALRSQLESADHALVEQSDEACCYARSDKYWIKDPAGIAWETFHTLGNIPVFGEDTPGAGAQPAASCCTPLEAAPADSACCVPAVANGKSGCSAL